MKKHYLTFTLFFSISTFLTGCATQMFVPKTLNEEARGISTVTSTPYGCRVLGEIEGKDSRPIQRQMTMIVGDTLSAMREGAMNDLRNNAVEVIGNSQKRTVLKIVAQQAICHNAQSCANQELEHQPIESYIVKAEVFECGDK